MEISNEVLKLAVEHGVILHLRRQSDGVDLEIRATDGHIATMVGLDGLAVRGEIHTATCNCKDKEFIMQPDELTKARALVSFGNAMDDIEILEKVYRDVHQGKDIAKYDWVVSKRNESGRCLGETDVFYVVKIFEPEDGLRSFVGITSDGKGGIMTSVQEVWRYRSVNTTKIKDFQIYLTLFNIKE
jgi:hypothetical protein